MSASPRLVKRGYLEIDHRASPGVTPEFAAAVGAPVAVGKGERFEGDACRCNHCQAIVILNPDRTRAREYCPLCFRYVCDACAATAHATKTCTPVAKQIDLIGEALVLGRPPPSFIGPGGVFQP